MSQIKVSFIVIALNAASTLDALFAQNKKKRIIIATFASNIHRIQQILDTCARYGRKVLFSGRSMLNNCETASKIGELKFNKENIADAWYISLGNIVVSLILMLCLDGNRAIYRMFGIVVPPVFLSGYFAEQDDFL